MERQNSSSSRVQICNNDGDPNERQGFGVKRAKGVARSTINGSRIEMGLDLKSERISG
jgi:hypothetical protein